MYCSKDCIPNSNQLVICACLQENQAQHSTQKPWKLIDCILKKCISNWKGTVRLNILGMA